MFRLVAPVKAVRRIRSDRGLQPRFAGVAGFVQRVGSLRSATITLSQSASCGLEKTPARQLASPLPHVPMQLPDPRNADILVHVNGQLLPRRDAKVSVFDSSVQGGDAVGEGLRLPLRSRCRPLRNGHRPYDRPKLPTDLWPLQF